MTNHVCLYRAKCSLYDDTKICLHPDNYGVPVDDDCKEVKCPIPKPKEAHI
jgi:hypothetical protein